MGICYFIIILPFCKPIPSLKKCNFFLPDKQGSRRPGGEFLPRISTQATGRWGRKLIIEVKKETKD